MKMDDQRDENDMLLCDICEENKVNANDNGKTFVYDSEGSVICKNCAYDIWDRYCTHCKCVFNSDDEICPQCKDDEDKDYKGRKAKKADIDKLFDK